MIKPKNLRLERLTFSLLTAQTVFTEIHSNNLIANKYFNIEIISFSNKNFEFFEVSSRAYS